jgi:hypothetical protein
LEDICIFCKCAFSGSFSTLEALVRECIFTADLLRADKATMAHGLEADTVF